MGNHHSGSSSSPLFSSVNTDHHEVINPKHRLQQQQLYETTVDEDDEEIHEELKRVAKEQQQVDENEIKNTLPFGVILLGSADSGKSTLWNRWKIQMQNLSQSEKIEFSNSILTYIITCLKRLVDRAKLQLTQEEYCSLYCRHDFTIDLIAQLSESSSLFEYLFINPISKTKMQSFWIDHDFISHLPLLFIEPTIQSLYYEMVVETGRNSPNVSIVDKEEGIVNEMLLGNYLHYFLQSPSFLQELSETFTHSMLKRDYSSSPTASTLFNAGLGGGVTKQPTVSNSTTLSLNDILKAKIVTTSINTLKFQFSKRSISTKVIKVIERRKRGLSMSTAATATSSIPSSSTSTSPPPIPVTTPESVQVHGKCGNISIPKLSLNLSGGGSSASEKSLLPKSARGEKTPRSNSVTSKPVSIIVNEEQVNSNNNMSNSPPKKTSTKKLVESLVRKRSSSNTPTTATTTTTSTTTKNSLTVSPANSPRTSITSDSSSFSPLMGGGSGSSPMPSPNLNNTIAGGSGGAGVVVANSSPRTNATSSSSSNSSVVKAMQENAYTLDSFEKKKLQKFTILDTPGILSQRDLVLMTLNASTRPTSTFSLKTVVFMCSLADFDLNLIDGGNKDEKIKRLHDSLSFFEKTLVLSNNLKEVRRILLFTHVDIFENRIHDLTLSKKQQLLELLGIQNGTTTTEEEEHACPSLENTELVNLTFKHIVSRFENLEKKNSQQKKYLLEYYAINLMDQRDVYEFTYSLTMRDGYLRKDYTDASVSLINVYSSLSVSGGSEVMVQNLPMFLMTSCLSDISFKFQ